MNSAGILTISSILWGILPSAALAATKAETRDPEIIETTAGWFRIDTDSLGTQFWLGATHKVAGIEIASDIYVVGSFAEFDVGPAFSFGKLALTPMVGIGFDFETTDVASLIAPQVFTIYSGNTLYFESWIQLFLNDLFREGTEDIAYTRNFLLYKFNDSLALGPQVELSYRINESPGSEIARVAPFEVGVTSLPVGARVNLGYGAHNTLGLFVGYDTMADEKSDGIAGRFTFIRSW